MSQLADLEQAYTEQQERVTAIQDEACAHPENKGLMDMVQRARDILLSCYATLERVRAEVAASNA